MGKRNNTRNRWLFKDVKSDIPMCLIYKYRNTETNTQILLVKKYQKHTIMQYISDTGVPGLRYMGPGIVETLRGGDISSIHEVIGV